MYNVRVTPQLLSHLFELAKRNPGIINALNGLADNPKGRAKSIEHESDIFGCFYVNAGNQHAITFDIDDDKKEIYILYVFRKSVLHKFLTKQLTYNPEITVEP